MIEATVELDCFSAYISLREPDKSEDKAEALVVKEIEEVENAEANSEYQDRAEGQKPRNFIRPISNKHPPSLSDVRRLRYWRKARSFPLSKGSARINKDQHNSAVLTPESIIGELEQYSGSMFNYSTTAVESNWEPRGMLQSE
ncbi:hypothetical protein BHE74_00037583 [Ensete ventricosum]|nr:hypothetical protein BHE74_00037583 [Ensete ventricosum]